MPFPDNLFDYAYLGQLPDRLDALAGLAEAEGWDYQDNPENQHKPILLNYIKHTYSRLASEGKIFLTDDGQNSVFNTGLVTGNQEPIYASFRLNQRPAMQQWYLEGWVRRGEHSLNKFQHLPEMAHYFDNPASLVFDARKPLRANVEHMIADNKDRFPAPFNGMDEYTLQTLLKGAIDVATERVRRNYKTAIPQFYQNRIQLLLPLCFTTPARADLAIVADDMGNFYRASTCLTLDMAYNNARQLTRPDRDWLQP